MIKKVFLGIGIVLIAGLVGIFIIGTNAKSNEEKVSVIHIGATAPGGIKFILFQEKGWMDEEFAKDKIKVEYHPFTAGGAAAMAALTSGSLDFTTTASNPALRAAAAGADVKIFALVGSNPLSTITIIVKNTSEIKSVKDLKGKKVAYLTGTMRHKAIVQALKSEGISINDIESFNLDFAASSPALIRGDIDAVVEGESTVFPLVSTGAARIILNGRDHPEWPSSPSPWTVRGDFARKHPNIVKRFLKVDLKTAQWAEQNFDETIKIYSNAIKKSESAVRKEYPDNTFYINPEITDKAIQGLKDEEVFMRENNLLEGNVDFTSWVDKSYLDSVIAESNKK